MLEQDMPQSLRARIYSASFGGGHHQANTALGDALEKLSPQLVARHTDYLTHLSGFERAIILGFYLGWLRYTPGIYRWYYHFTDRPSEPQLIKDSYRWLGRGRMTRELLEDVPELVVSSYPTPAAVAGWLKETRGLKFLNVLVVTDYRIHEHWVRFEADLMLVPTDESRLQMIERGIPAERVHVTGIPINARYRALIGSDKAALRIKHGLDPALPLLLLSGGGQGTYRSLNRVLTALGNLGRRVQVLVLAGAGRVGVEQLGGAVIHRLGFTTDFPELLAASDLVVGKAGGLTVAESTTLGVPMIVFDPIPGQEEHNAEYLERGGAAVWVRELSGLRPAILRALDPQQHARMSAGARALSVPDAADRAARIILETLEKPL
ncbi:cell wall synthesis protein [Deinococcus ruber]|uniref:Cell wall synthesis protein n=2 Tax=Deinococcus ruber TaxID=1848197 RepID=A0A918CAW7_9DEIO|nr:cell wall synthesis protein [Deinococcus ruber]